MSRPSTLEEDAEEDMLHGLDEAYMCRLAEQLLEHPVLLDLHQTNSHFYGFVESQARRREALTAAARALGPPVCNLLVLRKRFIDFRKLYFKKLAEAVRPGAAETRLPRWMRLVAPLLRAAPERARLLADAGGAAAERRERAALGRADAVLAALVERARSLRTVRAAAVCRELPAAPRVPRAVLEDVWGRMQSAARAKLDMLVACGDSDAGLAPAARLAPADWRLLDVMLLHDAHLSVVEERHLRSLEPLQALVASFHLAQLFRLEEGGSWRAAHGSHRRRGLRGSVVLLQRRWHELKQQARRALAAAAAGSDAAVCPLHAAIARRFPRVLTEPLSSWRELVASGAVLEECEDADCEDGVDVGEVSARLTLVAPAHVARVSRPDREEEEDDDDLILIEREIETVDLLAPDEDEAPARAEDFSVALHLRRRNIARALDEELDRQLRELEPPAGAERVKREPAAADDESDDTIEDESVEIDPKLLMTTAVPLARVDCTAAWRRHARGATLAAAGVAALAPPAPPPPRGARTLVSMFNDDSERDLQDENVQTNQILIVKVESESDVDAPPIVKVESESDEPPEATEDGGASSPREEGEGEGRARKRITLPDIAEVRRINRRMLTAQVAPLAAPAAAPRSRASSEEPALCIDKGEAGALLSRAALRSLLARLRRGAAPRAAASARGGAAAHCCAARHHRAVNDARRRCAARAGRAPPAEVELHAGRCGRACACCCRHLLDAERAARDCADAQRRLRDAVEAALDGGAARADESGEASEDGSDGERRRAAPLAPCGVAPPAPLGVAPPAPTAPSVASTADAAQKCKRKGKKRKREESDSQQADSDPLQEWIRQKNLTSRFFDLNLKRPAPARVPPSAPRPAAKSVAGSAPVPATGAAAAAAPVALLHVTPSISHQSEANVTVPNLPHLNSNKHVVIFPLSGVTPESKSVLKRGVLGESARSLVKIRVHAAASPSPTRTRTETWHEHLAPARGASGLRGAVPVALVPLQTSDGIQLVSVRYEKKGAGAVIDLCEASDEDANPVSPPRPSPSPPPAVTAPASTAKDILVRLPPGISVLRKQTAAPPAPPAPPTPLGGAMISRKPRHIAPRPAPTLEVSPMERGKSNIKVFKISEESPAPPAPPAPVQPNQITKIVIVPRGAAHAAGPSRPVLRLIKKPPPAAPAHRAPDPHAPPGLKIAEVETADGRRMLVMRRGAAPPAALRPAPHEAPAAAPAPAPAGLPEDAAQEGQILYGFSDSEVPVTTWVATGDSSSLVVHCLDRAVPHYTALGQYFVVTDRQLQMALPSYWTAEPTPRRLLLPAGAAPAAPPDAEGGRVYQKLCDEPFIYAHVQYVVRSARELLRLARGVGALRVVRASTGYSALLRRAPAAPAAAAAAAVAAAPARGALCLLSIFRAAAQEITRELNRLELEDEEPPAAAPAHGRATERKPARPRTAAPALEPASAPAPGRPSRRAARDARARVVDMLKEETEESGAGKLEYAAAHGEDSDDDEDYAADAGESLQDAADDSDPGEEGARPD